ncbi:MAG: Release factor glutamine methyltransferase [Candidatus Anoxychlamydiales bacterium]|nr:Release factor glutamine methyltransferase [Candidatus Anoxychlamydiales bacterium]
MQTISLTLQFAYDFLKKNNVLDFKKVSEMLLSFILKCKRYDLFLNLNKNITSKEFNKYLLYLNEKILDKPIAYIINEVEFYNSVFYVDENVLIPRVETEGLVDLAIKKIKETSYKDKVLIDLCSGSGAIGISIKKTLKDLKIYQADISLEALEIAKKNAQLNNVEIIFKEGDLLLPFENIKADFIICNPPYISKKEYDNLDKSVKNFEPKLALLAKDDGFDFYKRLEKMIPQYLKPCGKVFFEIGYMQKNEVFNIFSNKKWKNKEIIKDYYSNDRFFFLELDSTL